MRKLIGMLVALGVAAVTVVVAPAAPALAAVSPPFPPLGPGVLLVGRQCGGTVVPRCVELRFDYVNRRYRAWGSIIDNPNDSITYVVDVHSVVVSGVSLEDPGYKTFSDTLAGRLTNCPSPRRAVNVTYAAVFAWGNLGTGATDGDTLGGAATLCG